MDTGDILIAAAVAGELENLQKSLTGAVEQRIGEQRITSGRIGQQAVRLVVTGPGMANTVHGLTVAIMSKRPKLILQTGCGGGFREAGLNIGDVAIASMEIDVHLGLEPDRPEDAVGELGFPVIKRPGREIFNCYPVDVPASSRALQSIEAALSVSAVNVLSGPFITVATVTASIARSGYLYRHHGALVENMEGAGAAHTAALYNLPFVEIRAVSNRVGDRDKSKWDLPLAFQRCAQAVQTFLEHRSV
ncbi:MAG: futalosine hydrolase [Desulfobacterales bacterium]|nr:futalosine hydrolase [Desulfobacterales bacterium]